MNAISFFLKEHNKIRKTLAKIDNPSRRYTTKKSMFKALCRYLVRHETMEQTVWYPTFKNSKKVKTEVKHLLTEEKHAEKVIQQFKEIKTQEAWEAKFAKFKKSVEAHAHEEETKLFPNVEDILNQHELQMIGKKMRSFEKKHTLKIMR